MTLDEAKRDHQRDMWRRIITHPTEAPSQSKLDAWNRAVRTWGLTLPVEPMHGRKRR